jgi:hypothetical protein
MLLGGVMNGTALYVMILTNQMRFLHLSYCDKCEEEILDDAESQYELLQKYAPVSIEFIIPIQDFMEWNYHVKRYMKLYGIDTVRGGDYYNEELSYQEKRFIENELRDKTLFVLYPVKKQRSDEELVFNPDVNEDAIYNALQYIKTDYGSITINDEMIQDINWIREYIREPSLYKESYNQDGVVKKVELLFRSVKYIYEHGKQLPIKRWEPEWVFENMEQLGKCYIENPGCSELSPFYIELMENALSHVLYILHCCKNRMDEIFFDYHSSQLSKERREMDLTYWD